MLFMLFDDIVAIRGGTYFQLMSFLNVINTICLITSIIYSHHIVTQISTKLVIVSIKKKRKLQISSEDKIKVYEL